MWAGREMEGGGAGGDGEVMEGVEGVLGDGAGGVLEKRWGGWCRHGCKEGCPDSLTANCRKS